MKKRLNYIKWGAAILVVVLLMLHWLVPVDTMLFRILATVVFFAVVLPFNLYQAIKKGKLKQSDILTTGLVVVIGIVVMFTVLMRPNRTKTALEAILAGPNMSLVAAYENAQEAKVTNHETTALERMRKTLAQMGLTGDIKSYCEGNAFTMYHVSLAKEGAKATVESVNTEGGGERISFTAKIKVESSSGMTTKEVKGVAIPVTPSTPGEEIQIIEFTE